jgi:hypothetical protein
MRILLVPVVLSLTLLCAACSSDGRLPVYPVRGQVLLNGKPVANAQVLFHPAEELPEGLRPSGQTDDQGYFNLTSYTSGDGAPQGAYKVTVMCFRLYPDSNNAGEVVRYNLLPPHYAAAATSQLQATVSKGNNELPPLQLVWR